MSEHRRDPSSDAHCPSRSGDTMKNGTSIAASPRSEKQRDARFPAYRTLATSCRPASVIAAIRTCSAPPSPRLPRERALLLIQELEFRQGDLLRFVRFSLGLELPQALLLHALINAHSFRVPRRCTSRFFTHL